MRFMKKILLLPIILISQFFFINCSNNIILEKNEIDTLYFATWNVENLFDTIDDPDKDDQDFTPDGELNWTEEKLHQKNKNLAEIINLMNSGKGFDLLGVQEVEHKSLLEKLNSDYLKNKNYKIVYAESLDKRGIDNGLFYNSDLFELISYDTLRVDLADGWPTRYILYAELILKGSDNKFDVFINHWPSRSGGKDKSEQNRIAAATVLKNFTDKIISNDLNSRIVIMGDFNDDPTDVSLYETLQAKELECNSGSADKLYNTSIQEFNNGKGTYLYRKEWNMLDQIIISGSLLNGNDIKFICNSFEIIKPEIMINKEGNYAGSAIRTFGGKNYIGGYSDHFPVGIKISYKKVIAIEE